MIPIGLCQCGCGQKTTIALRNKREKGWIKGEPVKFIQWHNVRKGGEVSPAWKGGRSHISPRGIEYPTIRNCKKKIYELEHRVIAAKTFGRPLPPGSEGHHYGKNSEPHLVVICEDAAYHKLLHRRQRALTACGHAHWRKCWICKEYDDLKNLEIAARGHPICHPECRRQYANKRYHLRKEAE